MKVHQLIHRLQLFPPDAKIMVEFYPDYENRGSIEKPFKPEMIFKDTTDNIVWIDTEEE